MNIGEVAKKSGLSARNIRYYESVGLVLPSERRENGYRQYDAGKLRELLFLRHARQFGFSLEECSRLLSLFRNPNRRSQEVHSLVADKLTEIDQRIADLQALKQVLAEMSGQCANDEGADCSIIEALAAEPVQENTQGRQNEQLL